MDFLVPSTSLHILIADDHEIARFAFVRWLEEEMQREDIVSARISTATSGKEALYRIRAEVSGAHPIGLLVLDVDMPDMTGLEVIQSLRAEKWQYPILVVSGSHVTTARNVIASGANGFFSKQEGQGVFFEGVRFLLQNPDTTWLSPATHRHIMYADARLKKADLTPAEQNVLQHIKLSNKEIADELGITESTVKKHLWSIFQKLGIASRYDATAFALDAGLIASGR